MRAVNKTLIRLLGGSGHRLDQTGIHLKFLPTCNVNSFSWDRGLNFFFFFLRYPDGDFQKAKACKCNLT